MSGQHNNRVEFVIRDEAKIVHEREKTIRWQLWLPYGFGVSVLITVAKVFG